MGAIQELFNQFGADTVQIIRQNMERAGQNASGETSSALAFRATDERVTVDGPSHVFVLETGRGPGKQPPVGVIPKWIASKAISITGTVQSTAFAIQKTIAEKGTKLFQMGGRKDIITPAVSDERINELTSKIADIEFAKTLKVIDGFTSN